MRIFNAFITFFICFVLLYFNFIEIKETPNKYSEIVVNIDNQYLKEDTKIIKEVLIKLLAKEIKDTSFFNRYFVNKTIDKISKQLAVYYNDIVNFKDDPEKAIKLTNEIIENSHAYIEIIAIYLEEMKKNLLDDYNKIKEKYCVNLFEQILDTQTWREKATVDEITNVNEIEIQIQEIDNILNVINRIRMLFKIIDWTIHSHSPLAWLARKYIGW